MLFGGLFVGHELLLELFLNIDLFFSVFDFILKRLILFEEIFVFMLIFSIKHDIFHILLLFFFH